MYKIKHIGCNYADRMGKSVEYIVVHDTGNPRRGADADAHFNYFNKPGRNASAHYFVDSVEILQIVPDSLAAWHCGDGRGRHGITNSNSIGVELCINVDGDWEETKKKGTLLIRLLMERHGIPKERVTRHFDVSRKICPRKMSEAGWREWTFFYDKI
ncbi:N-acetylmuramoyl-L-alanine amidase family protein [Gudongella sp. DL1XJH-153]|uniref:peptidoglycan recognition protein family protein n=1 Tax=Gudongella sp. DL1XJH-153 TaxID=3409804 RepID=UPI003BB506F5